MNDSLIKTVGLTNHPEPVIDKAIRRKLTEIGGIIPHGFGEFAQKPVLGLLWGQTATAFDAGKTRIRFFDQDIDPVYTSRKFRLSESGFTELAKYQRLRDRKLKESFESGDWNSYHALLFAPMEYFLKRFINRADWEYLPENSSFEATAKLLPDGWYYFEDLPEVTEIGCENFYVCQWIPPDAINTRDGWELNRFGVHPLMEFYGKEHFVDILGEYPKYGAYWNILLKVEAPNGGYVAPNEKNCIEPVQRMVKEAQERKKAERSIGHRHQIREKREGEKMVLASHARTQQRKDVMREQGQVIQYGKTARIYPKDRRTKWGKPSRTFKNNKQEQKCETT